jgi:hypothetical protein
MISPTAVPRVLALSLFASMLAACGERGSGTPATELREVEGFDKIEVSGACDLIVHVEPGVAQKVEVTADDNIVGKITTTVSGGELDIGRDSDVKLLRPKTPIRVEVWVPALLAIEASGASVIAVGGLHGEHFELSSSGASHSTLRGAVDRLDISASGAGSISAQDLQAKSVFVDISGAGQAKVWASEALDVRISGAGNVTYWGSPASVTEKISGAGSLKKQG